MTRRALLAAALLLAPALARGHGLEPALLALREVAAGRFAVVWKSSKIRLPGAEVRPLLPDACQRSAEPPQATDDGDRVRVSWVVDCGPGGLAGQTVAVADLDVAKIDALLHVEQLDGTSVQTILTARQPGWTAPADPTRGALVSHYARLGMRQLFSGLDRLLFAVGLLLLLAPAMRRLVPALAGFTLGQSLALALVAGGMVSVPPRPVELLLAGGLLLLATRLADVREPGLDRGGRTWALALGYGVVAGCAAAHDLIEAGLPSVDAPLALLTFNIGIEGTQLAILSALLAVSTALARWQPRATSVATRIAVYGIGILAAFWCFERLAT